MNTMKVSHLSIGQTYAFNGLKTRKGLKAIESDKGGAIGE